MKDLVFMSPNNGQLVVGIPLYKFDESELLDSMAGYAVALKSTTGPLAYMIHADKLMSPQVFGAEWIEKNMICLGEL